MLHYQDMHNPVLLPQSWASLHWIFWERFPLAVCVHSPAHAPKAEPWAVLKSMAQQSRARISLHSLQVSHAFSRCTLKLFFSYTSGTQSRALDYCNTEQLTHSWLLPESEHHHRVLHLPRSFLSDIHTGKHISWYIFKLQTIQRPLSISTWCKYISLFL